ASATSWSTVWLTYSNQPVYEIQNESGTETAPGRAGLIGHPTFPDTLRPWQSLGKNVRIRRFMNAPPKIGFKSPRAVCKRAATVETLLQVRQPALAKTASSLSLWQRTAGLDSRGPVRMRTERVHTVRDR